nr:hypothetical protein PJ912_14020 [Pectobacterium colocasium]
MKALAGSFIRSSNLWKTAKPFLETWLKQQVGLPAVFRALKEKAPFWAEKLPEVPELFYDGLRQHKMLKHSVDQLAYELKTQQARQGQSRYLLGIGATLLISGTLLLISRVEADMVPAGLMAAGIVAWIIGWRRTR